MTDNPRDLLLWQAFPAGFVPMRGVQTLGEWQCLAEPSEFYRSSRWYHRSGEWMMLPEDVANQSKDAAYEQWKAGDFLPVVDPARDPTTWMCLLHNLAQMLEVEALDLRFGVQFGPFSTDEGYGYALTCKRHTHWRGLRSHPFIFGPREDNVPDVVDAFLHIRARVIESEVKS